MLSDSKLTGGQFGPFGIWTWDVPRDLVFTDPSVAQIFNLTAAEGAHGQPIQHFLHCISNADRDRVGNAMSMALKGHQYHEQYRLTCGRLVLAVGNCILHGNGQPASCAGYVMDLSSDDGARTSYLIGRISECKSICRSLENSAITYLIEALETELHLHLTRNSRRKN